MKKMSKLLALLLALVMVFCLAACGTEKDDDDDNKKDGKESSDVSGKEQSDEEKLLGEWICSFDLSDVMKEELASELDDSIAPNASLYMNLVLEFGDDAEFVIKAEVDKDSLDDYIDALADEMVDYMYEIAEDGGMTKEEFDDAIADEYDMTVKEYVKETLQEFIDDSIDQMSFETSGYYELNKGDGYIYIGEDEDELDSKEEAMEYKFSGSKLSISAIISEGEEVDDPIGFAEYGLDMPWKFEKK